MKWLVILVVACLCAGCGATATAPTAAPTDPDAVVADVSSDAAAAGTDAGGQVAPEAASGDAADAAVDVFDPGNAGFLARGGVRQVFVTHAAAEQALAVVDAAGKVLAEAKADALGSIVFRQIPPGKGYRVATVAAATEQHSAPLDVLDVAESQPPQAFYTAQVIAPGNGYITTRDGTQLAYFATLPGPADAGPYPTIVNYSGYDPARPGSAKVSGDQLALCDAIPVLCDAPADASAMIAAVLGYATVSVNLRGTGCSGGAYDYFETMQLLDGYDVIETVAAQPWVAFHKVGMTGLSYPGITQLFVARTQPPSLAAITPLSVIGNTVTTLVPGGILNSGFALNWIQMVYQRAAPYGQGWEAARVAAGDLICKENQLLHDCRVNNVDQAKDAKYYDPAIIDPLNPTVWVNQIHVPVFLAGAWQDEQTGPFFVTLLDKFTAAPNRRFTVYNGVHPDGFAPQVLVEWKAFLDIYVAHQKPSVSGLLNVVVPQLTQQVYGAPMQLPPDRWQGVGSWEEAKARWEAEPEVRALFEDGALEPIGAPLAQFELLFSQWPPKETVAQRFWFQPDGTLLELPPPATEAASTFWLDPTAGDRGILGPKGKLWNVLPNYLWQAPSEGKAVAFTSAPLAADVVMLGTGSVDFWIRSLAADVTDADLEVNLTEVRPDGQERYVQSGWLRASFRNLTAASTELWPEPSFLLPDIAPLTPGTWQQVRVAIAGFGHVFRKGSRLRIAIDTPGDSRAEWRFALRAWDHPVRYEIAHSAAYPSSVVLPVIKGAALPVTAKLPACPSLRGQPCRPFVATPNQPAPK